jgi:hypothetical protein
MEVNFGVQNWWKTGKVLRVPVCLKFNVAGLCYVIYTRNNIQHQPEFVHCSWNAPHTINFNNLYVQYLWQKWKKCAHRTPIGVRERPTCRSFTFGGILCTSVEDPGCFILDPDPNILSSRIRIPQVYKIKPTFFLLYTVSGESVNMLDAFPRRAGDHLAQKFSRKIKFILYFI